MSLSFKLITNTVSVTIEGTDGKPVEYELREMSSSARDKYLDRLSARMRIDNNGRPSGLKQYEGLQADLISNCLFKVVDDKPVPKEVIQAWPGTVTGGIFDAAQKLNSLNQEADKEKDEPPKND